MARAAELVGDRWMLLILREAFYGVQRYDDMLQDLGLSRAILTDRLNRLTALGILVRFPYREVGDRERHAYRLTEPGRALAPVMIALTQWGEAHVTGEPAPIAVCDRETGRDVRLELVDAAGKVVAMEDAVMRRRP